MSGEELFNQLNQRDFSGSEADEYAQDLLTMHQHVFLSGGVEKFYALLSEAHQQGKKLTIKPDVAETADEYVVEDLVIQ